MLRKAKENHFKTRFNNDSTIKTLRLLNDLVNDFRSILSEGYYRNQGGEIAELKILLNILFLILIS